MTSLLVSCCVLRTRRTGVVQRRSQRSYATLTQLVYCRLVLSLGPVAALLARFMGARSTYAQNPMQHTSHRDSMFEGKLRVSVLGRCNLLSDIADMDVDMNAASGEGSLDFRPRAHDPMIDVSDTELDSDYEGSTSSLKFQLRAYGGLHTARPSRVSCKPDVSQPYRSIADSYQPQSPQKALKLSFRRTCCLGSPRRTRTSPNSSTTAKCPTLLRAGSHS